jgi:ArsR family transcriptional regulator
MPRALKHRDLSDEALELIASRFKVLADPNRLRLLCLLESQERNVGELVALTQSTQTTVSRHLQALASAGLVSRRKDGQNAFYAISEPEVFDLCTLVCGSLQRRLSGQAQMARLFDKDSDRRVGR